MFKSRIVILAVLRGQLAAGVIENTIDECEGAITRAARQTGIDLLQSFRDTVRQIGVLVLPRISREEGRGYSSIKGTGDKAVAAAAARYSATICTNDLSDFKHAHRYEFRVTTPQQLTADGSIGLHTLVPGLLATPSRGTIYAEVTQLNWADANFADTATDRFYVFDSENIGCCYFDVQTSSFVASMEFGPRLCIRQDVVSENALPLHIVISYDCLSKATIFVGPTARNSSSGPWVAPSLISAPRTWVGCDRYGASQLNGCLRTLYGVPYTVSERAARNMMKGVTVANPWERLALEDIIELCVLGG